MLSSWPRVKRLGQSEGQSEGQGNCRRRGRGQVVKNLLPTSESTLDSRSILKSASIADVDAGGLQFVKHAVIEFKAVNG